jgi:hypothetical protein
VYALIRSRYESLTLKLPDGLDHFEPYAEQPRETPFFTQLVRTTLADVRPLLAVTAPALATLAPPAETRRLSSSATAAVPLSSAAVAAAAAAAAAAGGEEGLE